MRQVVERQQALLPFQRSQSRSHQRSWAQSVPDQAALRVARAAVLVRAVRGTAQQLVHLQVRELADTLEPVAHTLPAGKPKAVGADRAELREQLPAGHQLAVARAAGARLSARMPKC
jgi:hypothetical protein